MESFEQGWERIHEDEDSCVIAVPSSLCVTLAFMELLTKSSYSQNAFS